MIHFVVSCGAIAASLWANKASRHSARNVEAGLKVARLERLKFLASDLVLAAWLGWGAWPSPFKASLKTRAEWIAYLPGASAEGMGRLCYGVAWICAVLCLIHLIGFVMALGPVPDRAAPRKIR
jgi:hypothetical protein